jgi:hypothetical protein
MRGADLFIDDERCRVPSREESEEVALASEGGVNTVPVINGYKTGDVRMREAKGTERLTVDGGAARGREWRQWRWWSDWALHELSSSS